ncbi:hypothetical protein [Nocardia nova]|uniref:hypothetical protein n=1 Tax=Nocardia nova TaxID=37330 RepID=UPI0018935177|nr:hypothetical protein [Nocardia nova]MBF6148033.1 hypothetical protein [Nocardia nova]
MTDAFERNLDSRARRMGDIDRAVENALSDDPEFADLPVIERPLAYQEITTFHNGLCARFDWADVDLEAALTVEHRAQLQAWRERHREAWTTRDFAMVGIAGLVGAVSVWFDATIDREVREQFQRLAETERVRDWERAGKRLPIDYMDAGFGGRAHRIKSGGHDLLRLFTTLQQIIDGQFQGFRYQDGQRVPVTDCRFDPIESWPEAALRLMQHLAADFLTPMSLPIPGMSWLYEADSEAAHQFALHAFSGMRAGEGWNLRSATAVPALSTATTEIVIRTHTWAEIHRGTGNFPPRTARQRRKQNELLMAAHTLVAASSLGKAVANMLAAEYSGRAWHPAAIRHVQLPSLIRAGWLAVEVVNDARAANKHSARSWDELLIDSAQIRQLDLTARLDDRIDF